MASAGARENTARSSLRISVSLVTLPSAMSPCTSDLHRRRQSRPAARLGGTTALSVKAARGRLQLQRMQLVDVMQVARVDVVGVQQLDGRGAGDVRTDTAGRARSAVAAGGGAECSQTTLEGALMDQAIDCAGG